MASVSAAPAATTLWGVVPQTVRDSAAQVLNEKVGGERVGTLPAPSDGRFVFANLAAGDYVVRLVDSTGQTVAQSRVAQVQPATATQAQFDDDQMAAAAVVPAGGSGASNTLLIAAAAAAAGVGVGLADRLGRSPSRQPQPVALDRPPAVARRARFLCALRRRRCQRPGPSGPPHARAAPPAGRAATPAAAKATPTPPPVRSPNDYEVGIQDMLKVAVYGHDDLTQTVVVQADGTFLFPLVGRVKASNHTTAELERKLQTLLSQGFIRNPQVTVSVQEYRSKNVYVVGEVSKPGPYPLTGAMNILELVSKAGLAAGTSVGEVLIVRPHAAVTGPTLPTEKDTQADVIRVDLGAHPGGRHLDERGAAAERHRVRAAGAEGVRVGRGEEPGRVRVLPGHDRAAARQRRGGADADGLLRPAEGRPRRRREAEGARDQARRAGGAGRHAGRAPKAFLEQIHC